MASSISHPAWHERWRLAALWAGVLTGPLVWLTLLQTNYVLAHVACEVQSTWFLHLPIGCALLLVASAGLAAWKASGGTLASAGAQAPALSDDTRRQRSRWMSRAGVAVSAWFLVVILAMEIPLVVLKACQ